MKKSIVLVLTALAFAITAVAGEIHDAAENGNLAEIQKLLEENPALLNETDEDGLTPLLAAASGGQKEIIQFLLDKGADIKAVSNRGSTALNLASYNGHAEMAEFLIAQGLDINHTNNSGFTPLMHAAYMGQIDAAKTLLSKNPDLTPTDYNWGGTAFHWACLKSGPEMLEMLISHGYDVNVISTRDSSTPIFWAANSGNTDALEWLISKGVDPGSTTPDGWTPLHNTARSGHIEAARMLIAHGADPEAANDNRWTPLFEAIENNQKEMAEFLIVGGADPDVRALRGFSTLHAAAFEGNIELMDLLLSHDMDINTRDDHEQTPLHNAVYSDSVAVVRFLIEKGADINLLSTQGNTPICNAARAGNAEIVQILAENGADINKSNSRGETPLLNAVIGSEDEIIEILLNNGADIFSKDQRYGRTVLHRAAIKGNEFAGRLLLDKGANVNAEDNDNYTPLYFASKYGHKDVADLFKANGGTAKNIEENFGNSQKLKNNLNNGEAYLWYLGHCGWAVKTKNNLLIFDYWNKGRNPSQPLLANGHINPVELADQNVTVFVSHEHSDHFDSTIFGWADSIENISYIYGCRPELLPQFSENGYNGPAYEYIGPRENKEINGMNIVTIESNDAGVGFLINADGLSIYFAGDHAGWREGQREGYTREIDFLAENAAEVDFAFLNVTGCHVQDTVALAEAIYYTLDKLSPKMWVPTHGLDREYIYCEFIDKVSRHGCAAKPICAENRGDCFFYRKGAI